VSDPNKIEQILAGDTFFQTRFLAPELAVKTKIKEQTSPTQPTIILKDWFITNLLFHFLKNSFRFVDNSEHSSNKKEQKHPHVDINK
jgi:hypothetical protein